MKSTSSEWIIMANLMAGVLAVVIVITAVALAQRQAIGRGQVQAPARVEVPTAAAENKPDAVAPPVPQQQAAQQQAQPQQQAQQERVADVLSEVQTAFDRQGASSYVAVDAETGTVTLKERAFRRGSACIEPEAKAAFAQVERRIADYLQQFQGGRIYVEGHTDDKPVKAPVTDYRAFCTVYDDNFTLSAARAREARLLLISRVDHDAARRVIVAGYGDSQPLPGMAPGDERNRRVELRFVNGGERPR